MDTATETLVVINSIVLIVFLILGIIALVYFIKLVKQLRRIADQAENVVDSVEAAANTFQKAASPVAFMKLLSNVVDQASKFRKGKD